MKFCPSSVRFFQASGAPQSPLTLHTDLIWLLPVNFFFLFQCIIVFRILIRSWNSIEFLLSHSIFIIIQTPEVPTDFHVHIFYGSSAEIRTDLVPKHGFLVIVPLAMMSMSHSFSSWYFCYLLLQSYRHFSLTVALKFRPPIRPGYISVATDQVSQSLRFRHGIIQSQCWF